MLIFVLKQEKDPMADTDFRFNHLISNFMVVMLRWLIYFKICLFFLCLFRTKWKCMIKDHRSILFLTERTLQKLNLFGVWKAAADALSHVWRIWSQLQIQKNTFNMRLIYHQSAID